MAVRIEVTSENGEVDNYYLVISKEACAEEGEALLKKIKDENERAADQAAADNVAAKIDAIGTVSLDSAAAIEAARAAYEALTDEQRIMVANYETLVSAEQALAELNKPVVPSSPQTGDNTSLTLLMSLLVTSAACLAVLLRNRKKYAK